MSKPMIDKAQEQIELLPCPFCGESLAFTGDNQTEVRHYVYCGHCSASTGDCRTVDEAIKQWNARTEQTAELTAEVERLKGQSGNLALLLRRIVASTAMSECTLKQQALTYLRLNDLLGSVIRVVGEKALADSTDGE